MKIETFETSDGIVLSYRDYGDAGAPPVALVHGLAAGGRQFDADATWFAGHGRRVLVPDIRGHGASKISDPRKTDFSYQRIASDMVEMLDHAGIASIDWVGNSLGGIAALEMLRGDATRIGSLAMFGTALSLSLPSISARFIPWLYVFPGAEVTAKVTAFTTSDKPEARKLIESMLVAFDPEVGAALSASVRRYDLRAPAMDYTGPMMVLRGGKDYAVNLALSDGLSLLSGNTNFTLVEMPAGGHCANLDDPAFFRDTLERFWNSASVPKS